MSLSNTWKNYYQSLASNEDANKNLEAFAKDSNFDDLTDFPAQILLAFAADKDAVILAKAPCSDKIALYHSIKNLGGSRSRPTNKLVGLVGSGPSAIPVVFDATSISTAVTVDCPTVATLTGISDKTHVTTSVVPRTRPFVLHNACFQFLPPMISTPFLELGEKDPTQLLVEVNSIITAFDTEHDGDDEFSKVADHCKNIRAFLWVLANDNIDPIKCACDPEDAELADFCAARHATCIQPTTPLDDPEAITNTQAI